MEPESSDFTWQSYLLQGRPDFVNYIRSGDATWQQVWAALDELDESDAPVLLKACRFFFAFSSWEFDEMGCVLDPDSELAANISIWSRFAVRRRGALPEDRLQAALRELVNLGTASPLFYELVYECYGAALTELAASRWPAQVELPFLAVIPVDPDAEPLPWCKVSPSEAHTDLAEDRRWLDFCHTLLDYHRSSWSQGYAAIAQNMELLAEDRAAL